MTKEQLKKKYKWLEKMGSAKIMGAVSDEYADQTAKMASYLFHKSVEERSRKIKAPDVSEETLKEVRARANEAMHDFVSIMKDRIKVKIVSRMIDPIKRPKGELTKTDIKNAVAIAKKELKQYVTSVNGRSRVKDMAHNIVAGIGEQIKQEFYTGVAKMNNGKITKTWIHRPWLSKKPREGHRRADGQTVDINAKFQIPMMAEGRVIHIVHMDRPHDPNAPLDQVINCHCQAQYSVDVELNGKETNQ